MARLTDKQNDGNGKKISSRKKDVVRSHDDIPQFDLAEQILAEQRKLSSVKRKAPGKHVKNPAPKNAESSLRLVEEPPICSEQEKIIADIVARDINNLLKGNSENG